MTGSTAIVLSHADIADLKELGIVLRTSGAFNDIKTEAQAVVKVLAGRELGLGPVASMRSLHFVNGKVELSADLLAQRVKEHPRYDYRVEHLDEMSCTLSFWERRDPDGWAKVGDSTFSQEDRERAHIPIANRNGEPTPWKTYPRNMLFARAMSNGVAWYCPDVGGGGRIYVEGELTDGSDVTSPEAGSVVTVEEPDAGVGTTDSEPDSSAETSGEPVGSEDSPEPQSPAEAVEDSSPDSDMPPDEEPPPLVDPVDAERIEQAVTDGEDLNELASNQQWENALRISTKARILKAAHTLYGVDDPLAITRGQMAGIIKELMP